MPANVSGRSARRWPSQRQSTVDSRLHQIRPQRKSGEVPHESVEEDVDVGSAEYGGEILSRHFELVEGAAFREGRDEKEGEGGDVGEDEGGDAVCWKPLSCQLMAAN